MKTKVLGIALAAAVLVSSPLTLALAADEDEATPILISAPVDPFSDISAHWAKGAVEDLLARDALPFDGVRFFPDVSVTKSEFATMLHDALGIQMEYFVKPEIKDYFSDVDENAPYASDVIDLVTAGVFTKGGSFKPDVTLSREEMVHYLMLAYQYMMGDNYAQIKIGPASFADNGEITAAYSGEVARAEHYGFVLGCGNDNFEPDRAATRAEAATVVSRLADLLDTQSANVTVEPTAVLNEDSIEMKISITNNSDKDVTIDFTSGQQFDFELQDANREPLYRWSADKSFTTMLSTTTIKAGETLELGDTLSGDTYKAIKDKIVYMEAFITGQAAFIDNDGYEIQITP